MECAALRSIHFEIGCNVPPDISMQMIVTLFSPWYPGTQS
jgi:hypothetical protein